jgi:hypothetical protein
MKGCGCVNFTHFQAGHLAIQPQSNPIRANPAYSDLWPKKIHARSAGPGQERHCHYARPTLTSPDVLTAHVGL